MDHGSGKSPMDEKVKKLLRYCQKKAEEVLWLFFPKTLICRGRGKKKRIVGMLKIYQNIINSDTNSDSPSILPAWRDGVVSPSLLAASSALNP